MACLEVIKNIIFVGIKKTKSMADVLIIEVIQ